MATQGTRQMPIAYPMRTSNHSRALSLQPPLATRQASPHTISNRPFLLLFTLCLICSIPSTKPSQKFIRGTRHSLFSTRLCCSSRPLSSFSLYTMNSPIPNDFFSDPAMLDLFLSQNIGDPTVNGQLASSVATAHQNNAPQPQMAPPVFSQHNYAPLPSDNDHLVLLSSSCLQQTIYI